MKRVLLLTLAIVFLFSFVLAGCGAKTTVTPTASDLPAVSGTETKAPDATKAPEATTGAVEYKESPYFAGKGLPPVKDRLPKEPKIANEMPADELKVEIGTYGGILRTMTTGIEWNTDLFTGSNEPLLNSPGTLGNEITPNVLKAYEVSADQKEFTFHMREGMKWSDGTPVTGKDVQFAIDDVLFNKELTPIFPAWLCSGGVATGTPLKFTMLDDFTFKFVFDKSYGGLATSIAIRGWRGYEDFIKPSEFLKKYHKKYNTDKVALEAAIKAAKFKPGEWVNLFNDKDITTFEFIGSKSLGFPCLRPWMYTKKTDITAEFERNPYYFKVDSAGNQLPYIDKVISTYVQDMEVVTMKIISGDVDFCRELPSLAKMSLYKENEAKGGYTAYLPTMGEVNADIMLNWSFKNDNWRKVVQDERFRKALNFGINRQEINDTIYFGFGKLSPFQDITYDVAAANKLLDEMGMTKGADGFRVGPDGKKFVIPFEVASLGIDMIPLAELIVEQWKALGLDVTMKQIDGTLQNVRNGANTLQATVMWAGYAYWYRAGEFLNFMGPVWADYINTNGKKGEKPPADIQKLYDLVDKINVDKPEDAIVAFETFKNEIKAHNWWFNILYTPTPMIVNTKIGNVSENCFANGFAFSLEQIFYKK